MISPNFLFKSFKYIILLILLLLLKNVALAHIHVSVNLPLNNLKLKFSNTFYKGV